MKRLFVPFADSLRSIGTIFWKDLLAELRSREIVSAMLVFGISVILIFNFAIELNPSLRPVITPGVLWVTFIFAGTLSLNHAMSFEREYGCLDGLLLAPISRSAIYFGKALSNLVFMFIIELITLPVYGVLYNVDLLNLGFILVVFLGSIGYAAVGTLLSSMTAQTRSRDMLLPILLFPVIIPLLLASVKASSGFLYLANEVGPWLNILVVYDVVFIALAFMFYDFVIEE